MYPFSLRGVLASIAVVALLMTCGCAETLQKKTGTVDLMEKAVSLSDYADTGLSNLIGYGYGSGKFDDFLTLHANPLDTADYVLSSQARAAGIQSNGQGLSDFCDSILTEKGFCIDVTTDFLVYDKLDEALEALFVADGNRAGLETAKQQIADLASSVKKPLAKWLSAVAYAYEINRRQTAGLSDNNFDACASYLYCRVSGAYQNLSDVCTAGDAVSETELLRSGALVVRATCELAKSLKANKALTKNGEALTITTPAGNLIFGTTNGDTYHSPDALLLIDPAGDDTYNGRIAASSSLEHPISVVLDLAGNDIYQSQDEPSQGCGILGTGLLFDMKGNDTYTARRMAQGCAMVGTGLLFDGGGDDRYNCEFTGQASGIYGLAVLADAAGKDEYRGVAFTQASAGPRGMAFLIDMTGDDIYYTEPDVQPGYEGVDYGGDRAGKVGNFSQGCGWGQRSMDTGDNGIAGGIAGAMDFGGNDSYTGALWVQGTGYWSGVGFVYNQDGDDTYNAHYYSQASVAHYGIGLLVDVGGNDSYSLDIGAGLSFVWDRGVSLLLDDGGNDTYWGACILGGCADSAYDKKGLAQQDMTYSFFIDTGGDDTYCDGQDDCWGYGRGGYMIDAGGEDHYLNYRCDNDWVYAGDILQEGGIFIDASEKRDGSEVPYVGFWEKARKKNGLGSRFILPER